MKILILGLGVIGTAYGYAFQKAGFETEHFIREGKRENCPKSLSVKLLDGRYNNKGENVSGVYNVNLAQPGGSYDLIIISVSSNKLEDAVKTLNENNLKGTVLLFNGITEERSYLKSLMKGRKYILGYPVAGGQIDASRAEMDCVLFDHIMMERKEKSGIDNYGDILSILDKSGIKAECPFDMLEWIWLHMAINAGVITTAATLGSVKDTAAAARSLMDNPSALGKAILTIRECIEVVKARGVNLNNYKNDITPYKMPSKLAGLIMKCMFKTNMLTRRIMELHANLDDLRYVCRSVYDKGKELGVKTPRVDRNFEAIIKEISDF